jgi:hypothetical protein
MTASMSGMPGTAAASCASLSTGRTQRFCVSGGARAGAGGGVTVIAMTETLGMH